MTHGEWRQVSVYRLIQACKHIRTGMHVPHAVTRLDSAACPHAAYGMPATAGVRRREREAVGRRNGGGRWAGRALRTSIRGVVG